MMRLETDRLIIRNWEDRDRDLFHRINSDDDVMQFFPFRRSRAEADAFLDRIRAENEARGYGFTALELKQGGACIGFAGLYPDNVAPSRPAGAVEIGWRLAPEFWGKGYVTEAAEALLAFGFEELGLKEIISFAVWNNDRSTAVMRRIGMTRHPEGDFDHPRVPDTHPQLKRHVLYALKRQDWAARR
ncbi:GNAT family N-acetyltransferase [Neoaquamicrobium sediminum]|uniref:GNAT family N-acetyltransferase n=1 Tax=Neoaquamicrobium sediminum TaxID=1849104 RepID=UPI003BAA0C9A